MAGIDNWRMIACRPVSAVRSDEELRLFGAATGAPLPLIDAMLAVRIASSLGKKANKPSSKAIRVSAASLEYCGTLPAWCIVFANPDATSVFVAADTGRITEVRSGDWRLYDFYWSLQIMDWKNHENFSTPWLLSFALGGLIFGETGTLFMHWPFRRKRRANASAVLSRGRLLARSPLQRVGLPRPRFTILALRC